MNFFHPLKTISPRSLSILVFGQVVFFLAFWAVATPMVIPKPWEVISATIDLFNQGILGHLVVSLWLYCEAVLLSTLLSMFLCYAATMSFFEPLASVWGKFRFLGMTGLPFLFTLYISSAHNLKLALLTFSISVFMIVGMIDALDAIPRVKFDLARTLRMKDWEIVWEVMVLGRVDVLFDVIRQNAAIGFFMLGMVEALFRSEGGIGAVLATQDKHMQLAAVASIQGMIFGMGLLQDYILGRLKLFCCPYAALLLERR
jgi:NitT/TauT family transport system permease protein